MTEREAYNELYAYSMMRGDGEFIAQHVIDAFAAQTADEHTKPMILAFALAGLYLHVDRHFTGRQVQRAHHLMASRKCTWPSFPLPSERGLITASDVLAHAPGQQRDEAIHAWSAAVWRAFGNSAAAVHELLSAYPEILYDAARSD